MFSHHALPYVEHELSIFRGDTYLPGYVRLRMAGCDSYGGALVSRHSGSTSAAAGGCDGAVVPTLVDWDTGEVIVDSKRICLLLDAVVPARQRLRAERLAPAIDAQLSIVDELPNYQMLMGRTVAGGEASATRQDVGASLSRKKVAWCDAYLRDHAGDPALVSAYTAKRAKELSAADDLFSAHAMHAAYAHAEAALADLDGQLDTRPTRWLLDDALTMADLFWGIELLRMRNVGVAHFWEGGRLPAVEAYLAAAEALPAIRTAVIDWPGATF